MVRKIREYVCEICKKSYGLESEANKCESKGIPKLYPIGLIFSMAHPGKKIVFAIIKQQPQNWGHHHSYSTWACRDTPAGDNVGEESYCGVESWDKIHPSNKNIPAYKRMIKALKDNKIKLYSITNEGKKIWKLMIDLRQNSVLRRF